MSGPDAAFYFDLASPEAYLAAERALRVLPGPCEWRPILASRLPHAETFEGYRCAREEEIFRDEVARRAAAAGLQPLRWPDPFPFDSSLAMRVATYARRIGRTVAFAQAAFRQAFAGGHALSISDHVLIAAAACEMHPTAVTRAAATRGVREELERTTAEALELGVTDVPAVRVGEVVLVGGRSLERAGELLW
ncbi:MAG: DsbA family protein [Solirubrobacteraceae bacterium]